MLGYLYARQSQGNPASIEQQLELGRAWFDAESVEVRGTYTDRVSASRFAQQARTDWPRLLADLATVREPATLWLWESSRGDRDAVSWLTFLAECRGHGVLIRVHTDGRTYDVRNARDWRTLAEDGIDNAMESEKTHKRVMRAVSSRAAAGRPHGRHLYGYAREYDAQTGQLAAVVEHLEHGPIVREMARRVLSGETLYGIAAGLTRRGVPTPEAGRWNANKLRRILATHPSLLEDIRRRVSGGEAMSTLAAELNAGGVVPPTEAWDPTMVRSILLNPGYTGRRYLNGVDAGPAMWPALIDEATHVRLRAILTAPERRMNREAAVKHLLTGIARCGRCGGGMRVRPNGVGKRKQYACGSCFRVGRLQEPVDFLVTDTVVKFLARPDAVDVLSLRDGDEVATEAFAEIEEKRARLAAFEAEAVAGRISAGAFARFESALLAEIEAAKRRTMRSAAVPVIAEVAGPDAAARWEKLTMSQRRQLVTGLMSVTILPQGKGNRAFDPSLIERRWHHESAAGSGPGVTEA